MSGETSTPKRVSPPLYKTSGNASEDRLAFFHILERLKTQKRTGWIDHKVRTRILGFYISDHMYRMAVLAMCTSDTKLDVAKCVMLAIVHDLAEAQVGDIAPREGIPKAEKRRLEAEAMHNFVHEMLHNSAAAQRIEALWRKEYENQQTDEARFVKDLDRFEMASQALEYERAHAAPDLQSFFDSSVPHLRHPEVREWGRDLLREREAMQKAKSENSS
ncbi:HD domain-containing protein [Vararia minispora EC-137]|uniref:HD domain-containing protein n=1 Tax=Vararia minispora EC-137 TaxID=1314806 RepID=A0ACB8QLG3_9AGAM|nr:HD domain-containing protein [Vararia minispora EC-137]